MVDILLTHCNHIFFDRKQTRKMQPYPPLQTLLAAACLRKAGFEVAFFDATFQAPEEGFRAALDEFRPRMVAICEDNFNFLTKMCLMQNRELAFRLCHAAKDMGLPVVVNSSDASDNPGAYLAERFDYVIMGELEETLVEVATLLLNAQAEGLCYTDGLAYLDPGTRHIRYTAPRVPLLDLDSLPSPAWDLLDAAPYREAWMHAHGYFSLIMASSRGCPYHCNWCAKPIFGQSYRVRSPRMVAEEMRLLKTTFQPDQLWFADDIFALSAKWTLDFAAQVEALDAHVPFKMQSRCDLMTRETVGALRRAGCAEVWMGAESGSQKILDAMEKGGRIEHVYEARENLRSHGIRACFFLQFGYPGETWEDLECTIRMVRETAPDDVGISVSYPLPGTKFYQLVSVQLGAKKNWSDSDDLAMMFQGAYTSEFYRALRDALHYEVDARNGRHNGGGARRLRDLWRIVEELEPACLNSDPTPLWTCS